MTNQGQHSAANRPVRRVKATNVPIGNLLNRARLYYQVLLPFRQTETRLTCFKPGANTSARRLDASPAGLFLFVFAISCVLNATSQIRLRPTFEFLARASQRATLRLPVAARGRNLPAGGPPLEHHQG